MKREITISIDDRDYVVKYPNVGQFIDMGARESSMSRGTGSDMMFSGIPDQEEAYVYIKVVCFFETCCPDVIKDLKVKRITELDPVDFQKFSKAYSQDILPWLNEVKEEIQKING